MSSLSLNRVQTSRFFPSLLKTLLATFSLSAAQWSVATTPVVNAQPTIRALIWTASCPMPRPRAPSRVPVVTLSVPMRCIAPRLPRSKG